MHFLDVHRFAKISDSTKALRQHIGHRAAGVEDDM
jgi:hypothetical protein